jgi:tripartite-type tricarboxylate transporter receptor subunit TctC
MKKLFALLLALALLSVSAFAFAEAPNWPTKDITIICTHGAGGDTDYNARLMARYLEAKLGVSVTVTNVTGSNGNIAMNQYKDGDNSGYTFVMTNTAALVGNEVTGVSDFSYEAFEPVAIYGRQSGENIIVMADSPYNTLQDLIDASKANPDKITFGISTGGGVYIAATILNANGLQCNFMDQGDANSRLVALLGGNSEVTDAPYATVKEYIEAGKVKSLCTLLGERPTLIPDVPTASETVPDCVINTLYACLAPKGTDPAIVKAMNDAIMDITTNNAEYGEECLNYNLQAPWSLSVEDTLKELQSQRETFLKYLELF